MKLLKNKKGQSLVEFAIVLPLIVFMIGFIITGGQFLLAKNLCQQAAFQGGRIYVVGKGRGAAERQAKKILNSVIGGSNPQVNITGGSAFSNSVNIKTSIDITPLFPVDTDSRGMKTINGQITMMYERK